MSSEQEFDYQDPEVVLAQEKREKRVAMEFDARTDGLRYIAKMSPGRSYLWALIDESGVFRASDPTADPHVLAFREGERNFGVRIWNDLKSVAPEKVYLMMQEATERAKQE